MVCWVAARLGVLLKMRAVGLSERPGSGEAKPLSVAAAGPLVVGRVRVPVRGPVAVGLKAIWMEQEAFWARVPVQEGPPLVFAAMAKSPVMVGVESVMGVVLEVRLLR